MKKIITLLPAILLFAFFGHTQEITGEQIPVKVRTAFEKKYTAATEVKYVQEKRNVRVSFKEQEAVKTACYSSTGTWVETTTAITDAELPKKVVKSVSKNFKGFEQSNLCMLETPQVAQSYRMDLKTDKQGYQVQFSPKGDIIRKMALNMGKPKK